MPIPTIKPYALPGPADLPQSPVGWTVDPERVVLLIHDMQQYFVDFLPADLPPRTGLVDNVARLRAAAVVADVPVVFTAQPGGMTDGQRGLLRDFWGPGMATTARHRRILPELGPGPDDAVITKWRYSAFARTDLLERLQMWGRDQIVVCGVYAHVGCLMTVCDAFTADVQPFLVADAVADFSRAEHDMALSWVAARCGATPLTADVVAALGV